VPAAFFIALIFIGSYFMLNLTLAVIMDNYIVTEDDSKGALLAELQKQRNALI
jgi:hypothetical protein